MEKSPKTVAQQFLLELRSRTQEPIERLCQQGEALLEATAVYLRQENLPVESVRDRVLSSFRLKYPPPF